MAKKKSLAEPLLQAGNLEGLKPDPPELKCDSGCKLKPNSGSYHMPRHDTSEARHQPRETPAPKQKKTI